MLNPDTLDAEIQELPPLPATFAGALAALDNEDVDYATLEREISKDPALSIRLLAVANSSFYGLTGEVASLKEAFLILGVNTARSIVLTTAVMDQFSSAESGNLDVTALWRHSVGTGTVARVLARQAGVPPDTAFTAGLLHDIGKMVLNMYFADDYAQVAQYRDKHDCLLLEAEEAVLGFNHSLVGGKVAARWNLSAGTCQALADHHSLQAVAFSPLTGLVHVADIVSRGLEIGDGGDSLIPVLSPDVLTRLGITLEIIASHLPEVDALMTGVDSLSA